MGDEFEPEFDELPEDVQTEILALSRLLQQFGPQLGRPHVDTLKGSRYANLKELRFSATVIKALDEAVALFRMKST